MADKLLRVQQVAEIMDTSLPRAYELVRQGVIPGVVRLGRQIRVNPSALADWIDGGGTALASSERGGAEGALNDDPANHA